MSRHKLRPALRHDVFSSGVKIKWDLRDDFHDTRAAGSVDGTPATPGPGTRAVTDTENKLSIGSSVASFAGGKAAPAYGDPALWYGAFSREVGKVLVYENTYTSGALRNAWSENTAGTNFYNYANQSVSAIVVAGSTITVGAATTGLSYKFATVPRLSGVYYFIKGGAQYLTWTLLYFHTSRSTATLYPSFGNHSAIFTSRFIRIPTPTWTPDPLAYDTFTRANGAIGSSEATGPESQVVTIRAWTGATWTIATNKSINTPTLGAELATGNLVIGNWYSITASDVDYFYVGSAIGDTFRAAATTALDASNKVKLITLSTLFASLTDNATTEAFPEVALTVTAATQAGIVLNLDSAVSPANFVIIYHDGTNVKIEKCVAGTYSTVASTAKAYSANATIKVQKIGTAYRVYYNNALIGASNTISDAGIVSNTIHGQFSTDPTNTFNDYILFPSNSTYSWLDKVTR